MRLATSALRAVVDGQSIEGAVDGAGTVGLGPLAVTLDGGADEGLRWSVANRGDAPVRVRSVAVGFEVVAPVGSLRMFRNGYQSWSPSGVATFGVDRDPSTAPGGIEMARGVHHADPRPARDGELRSEWVTALADDGPVPVVAGFEAGTAHDGTWRLCPDGDGPPRLWAEAYLGDAVVGAGRQRALHGLRVRPVSDGDVPAALDSWATEVGRLGSARVAAAYQVGWCSWYQYFHAVTERDLRANLASAADWPFDVFQLDDGYQAAIGDWLATNERFPSAPDTLAAAIAAEGRRPGIWLAPFIVAPDSVVATTHPDWLARFEGGEPLWGMFNPDWGGGRDGIMYALDTTRPEVLAHLEGVARSLVDGGFTYLKLDFTFAPSFDGVWADATRTPAERVRAGYEAIRRGAGDDAFVLGCGAPLSHVVGLVDGNRIGPDVAPSWSVAPGTMTLPGYEDAAPATRNAWANTLARSFMHRRLWLNDPDCVMLRTEQTDLGSAGVEAWAHAVAVSGGMALVSDDLSLLGPEARSILDEVVSIGRAVDAAARTGPAPRCEDLLDAPVPSRLSASGYELVGSPSVGSATLHRP